MTLSLHPITLTAARLHVQQHHSHLERPQGGLCDVGVADDGRPTARLLALKAPAFCGPVQSTRCPDCGGRSWFARDGSLVTFSLYEPCPKCRSMHRPNDGTENAEATTCPA